MAWEVFTIIGTIAFAVSGALVAMEEEYDIFGVLILGLVTAFGGGVIRNLLIGVPVDSLWEQGPLLKIALISIIVVFFLPFHWIDQWKKWLDFSDAIGLSAFSIQGALYAVKMGHSLSAVMVAAILTGIGGGIIRDVLAGRKPFVFREEIYAAWAMLSGLLIGLGKINAEQPYQLYTLCALVIALRMLSVYFDWRLPKRFYTNNSSQNKKRELSAKKPVSS